MPIRLRLLGGARIDNDEGPVRGRAAHRRRLGLLAILSASPGASATRDRLIGLLWPDHPEEGARKLLSEALYVIRKELGEATLTAAGDEIRLDTTLVTSDLQDFLSAVASRDHERAVAAYGGPFLDGWYVADAEELEHWVSRERARLADACAGARRALAESREAAGDWNGAVSHWRELVRLDPFNGPVVHRLARALAAGGERGAALQAIAAHEAVLQEELGAPIEPVLAAFANELRTPVSAPRSVSPVQRDAASAPDAASPAPGTATSEPATSAESLEPAGEHPQATARSSPRMRAAATLAGVVVLVALTVGALMLGRRLPLVRPDPPDPRHIAVLYFDDHSAGRELGYIADAVSDELTTRLGRVPALHVVPMRNVRPFRRADVGADSIASALGVGTIVEGSISGTAQRLRVTARIIDVTGRFAPLTMDVERPLADILELQDQLADHVATGLRQWLGETVRLREREVTTESGAALDLYRRAMFARNQAAELSTSPDPADVPKAIRHLTRADSLLAMAELEDPAWVAATVARGWVTYDRAMRRRPDERHGDLDTATAHADRAIATDARSVAARELRGTVQWRLVLDGWREGYDTTRACAAERDLRMAVQADTTQIAAAVTLSRMLRERGEYAEADVFAQRALASDTYLEHTRNVMNQLYRSAMQRGDQERARRWCARGHELLPADWMFVECELTIMRMNPREASPPRARAIVAQLERLDNANKARVTLNPYSPYYRRLMALSIEAAHGRDVRPDLARIVSEVDGDAELRVDAKHDVAFVLALLGDRAAAQRTLDEYVTARPEFRRYVARDPEWPKHGVRIAGALAYRCE